MDDIAVETERSVRDAGQPEKPIYITLENVAQRYGVHRETVRRWRKDPSSNFPRPYMMSRSVRFKASEIEAWDLSRRAA